MSSRTAVITTALAVALGAAAAPVLSGPAAAGPAADPSTSPDPGPTAPPSAPPTTRVTLRSGPDVADADAADDIGIAPGPTTLPTASTTVPVAEPDPVEPNQVDPDQADPDEAGPLTIEIEDDTPVPPKEWLAPCGTVPYNLSPVGPVELVDMTGDGTADDRLSIRRDGTGPNPDWWLHLETADGIRSEAQIRSFTDHTPAIGSLVEIEWPGFDDHPAPDADEVLVRYGFNPYAQFWAMYGTDERGCIAGYHDKDGGRTTLMLRHDDVQRAGWECWPDRRIFRVDATRKPNGWWNLEESPVWRVGPTTTAFGPGSGATLTTSQLPYIGGQC